MYAVLQYTVLHHPVIAMARGVDLTQLTFIGLMAMWDPPRSGVEGAVRELLGGGVDVKMITGDAKETGVAIGKCIVSTTVRQKKFWGKLRCA